MRRPNENKRALGAAVLLLTALVLAPAVLGATGAAPEAPIELNGASVAELTALPGVGQVIAERIVAWRDEHGPFQRVEDLLKVKGIGERSFQKLRPHVTVAKKGK